MIMQTISDLVQTATQTWAESCISWKIDIRVHFGTSSPMAADIERCMQERTSVSDPQGVKPLYDAAGEMSKAVDRLVNIESKGTFWSSSGSPGTGKQGTGASGSKIPAGWDADDVNAVDAAKRIAMHVQRSSRD